jgi:L-rhamnose mutarotase
MKRYARTCHLVNDPEAITFYCREHARVWPEVLRALRDVGVREMRIWIVGNRLFMLCECADGFDPPRDWARYLAADPRIAEWEAFMGRVQVPPPESAGDKWIDMPEIFCLTDQLAALERG